MPTDQMFATSLGEFMVVGDFYKRTKPLVTAQRPCI